MWCKEMKIAQTSQTRIVPSIYKIQTFDHLIQTYFIYIRSHTSVALKMSTLYKLLETFFNKTYLVGVYCEYFRVASNSVDNVREVKFAARFFAKHNCGGNGVSKE